MRFLTCHPDLEAVDPHYTPVCHIFDVMNCFGQVRILSHCLEADLLLILTELSLPNATG